MSDYGWLERLRAADGALLDLLGGVDRVEGVLKRLLYPIHGIRRASLADDLMGVDYWADRPQGTPMGVDVKCRKSDHGHDLLIEFESNTTSHAPGWTIKEESKTDFVLYLWPERETLISYPQLRAAAIEHLPDWLDRYPEKDNVTTTDGGRYRTRWIAVPDPVVFQALGWTAAGSLLPVTSAITGPHCPQCQGAPVRVTPSWLDPSFVDYRCDKRHEWQGAA